MKDTELDIELKNCTFVKTVLMLVVVFYHSMLFWSGTWFTKNPVFKADLLNVIASWLDTFHVYGFTLVSGYIFYYLKEENGKYVQFTGFIKSKIKRLILPYFFVTIIWVAPHNYIWNEFDLVLAIEKYLLGYAPSQLWFLLMLFNVFILAWLLSVFLIKYDLGAIFVGIIFVGIGLLGSYFFPNYFQIWTSFKYIIFFIVGFKLRQNSPKFLMKIPCFIWVISSLIMFYASNLLRQNEFIICKILSLGFTFGGNIIGALMSFFVLQKVAWKMPFFNKMLVKYLSEYSMTIYLFHQQFIYWFISAFNGIINPYLHVIVSFVGAIMCSVLLSKILKKYQLTRFLIGEK